MLEEIPNFEQIYKTFALVNLKNQWLSIFAGYNRIATAQTQGTKKDFSFNQVFT